MDTRPHNSIRLSPPSFFSPNNMTTNQKTLRKIALLQLSMAMLISVSTTAAGQSRAASPHHADDSASVASVVHQYQRALATGDSAAALALLAPDAVILESGGIETREEYRSHHLKSDIEFARAVKSTDSPLRVRVRGDVAWVASTSTAEGQFRGRPVNSFGAELMVLTRTARGWEIAAIHWSSRARRTQ